MPGFWFLRGRFLYSPLDLLPQAGRFLFWPTLKQHLINARNVLNALFVRTINKNCYYLDEKQKL